MSSSFKQKKLKTLATRKKTRKRKMESGMTHEDESGRLFQPPSRRDPRWKKPELAEVVESVVRAAKKRRVAVGSDDEDDDEDDDEPEMVDPIESEDDVDGVEEEQDDEEAQQDDAEEDEDDGRPKPPVKLCGSLEDCVAAATKKHAAIRRKDTRQKAKVLILADAPSLLKMLKKSLPVKAVIARSTSKRGVRSSGDKKVDATYKNIAPLKTPMEKFKESNADVLKDYKVGRIATLVAEDTSFYPYSDLAVAHVILVAKSVASAVNLDRALLGGIELHTFVVSESTQKASLLADDRARLAHKFTVIE